MCSQGLDAIGNLKDKIHDILDWNPSDIWNDLLEQLKGLIGGALQSVIGGIVAKIVKDLATGVVGKILDLLKNIVEKCGTAGCILSLLARALCAARDNVSDLVCLIKQLLCGMIGPLIDFLLSMLLGALRDAINKLREAIRDAICRAIEAVVTKIVQAFCGGGKQPPAACSLCDAAPPGSMPSCDGKGGKPQGKPGSSGNCPPNGGPNPKPSACNLTGGCSCLSNCGNCFAAGTPIWTPTGRVAIESLLLGQRVSTFNSLERCRFGDRPDSPIDPETWQVVRVAIDHGQGYTVVAELLRGPEWLKQCRLAVGGTVFVNMPEMGIEGDATVLAVDPCPVIEEGPGRVVTALFRHGRSRPHALWIDGEPEPVRSTPLHPFWCENKEGWISTQDLEPGDLLRRGDGGASRVQQNYPGDEDAFVFNIEVDGDHVYRVGAIGLLVHNVSQCCSLFDEKRFGPDGSFNKPDMDCQSGPDGRAIPGKNRKVMEARVCGFGQPRPYLPVPCGWPAGLNEPGKRARVARCHLLGNQFGGPASQCNLVACCQTDNQAMANVENELRRCGEQSKGCVDIIVTATYSPDDDCIPRSIKFEGVCEKDGKCTPFSHTVTNPPNLENCP